MGAGIAHAFLQSGASVTVIESDADAAARAHRTIAASLTKAEELGKLLHGLDDVLAALEVSTDRSALSRSELVIEAVPEIPALKREVLAAAEENAPGAWIASNTSSLSLDALSAAVRAPERLIGLHFFNPVPASSLVEIVTGTRTDPELVSLAQGWVEALGKTAITVRDSPGFASSRLGVALALEAIRMLEEGVADAADIDTAMTLGYRHPVGPLRTTDIVGLDGRLAIAEALSAELGDRFAPPELLREKVADGHLGRKTGQGFYTW
jgi:3-hydroxybutyryl-CoA dehydrogenase